MPHALATERQRRLNARQQLALVRSLQKIRKENGLSVNEVADYMGVDSSMVYRFEKGGTNYTMGTVRKYAAAVGAALEFSANREETLHADGAAILDQSITFAVHAGQRASFTDWVAISQGTERRVGKSERQNHGVSLSFPSLA